MFSSPAWLFRPSCICTPSCVWWTSSCGGKLGREEGIERTLMEARYSLDGKCFRASKIFSQQCLLPDSMSAYGLCKSRNRAVFRSQVRSDHAAANILLPCDLVRTIIACKPCRLPTSCHFNGTGQLHADDGKGGRERYAFGASQKRRFGPRMETESSLCRGCGRERMEITCLCCRVECARRKVRLLDVAGRLVSPGHHEGQC